MSLTVSEREHWKARIAARIDKMIITIQVASKKVFDDLKQQARERALAELGIDKMLKERDDVSRQVARLEVREKALTRKIAAAVKGVSDKEVSETYTSYLNTEIDSAIKRREAFELDLLMAETEEGRKVLSLKQEKENLLDTVWLATSPAQIKELWQQLTSLLGDEATPLQQVALAIKPVE